MRVLTRSDFDGLACCVLLKEVGVMTDVTFVHPKDIQDGKVDVTSNDILANVPYVAGCGMWFDHHSSEEERHNAQGYKGESRLAPSAARVIYEYYGGKEKLGHLEEFVVNVDKADSGQFTAEEILNPAGWVLLSFVMDPRTGLGRYRDYRISNYNLMLDMIGYCARKKIDDILEIPDVKERVARYFSQEKEFEEMIKKHTSVEDNVIITDLRGLEEIKTGNRFVIYALYPKQNISIWIVDGKQRQNAVFAVGHSILNRTSKTNVGSLMLKNGGGGHSNVGTCQVPYDEAPRVLRELVASMKKDG
ncbi:MAG: exopolyphosphatase [Nitrospinota bacterium]|nr:exopolyphosphatase [Nitrospinota bacterium]